MELVIDCPVARFFTAISSKTITSMRAAYPFVTSPIVRAQLLKWMKHRKTRLALVCNLSPFIVATSFVDPTEPLLALMDALDDRVVIRSHPRLHAKVFIADDHTAIFGSSNLTRGGEGGNREVNALLVGSKKKQKERILELTAWFEEIQREAAPVDRDYLVELSRQWTEQKGLRAQILKSSPEPRLGDDYWKKARDLAKRAKTSKSVAETLLSSGADNIESKPRNFLNKLIFLRNTGIVARWDDKWVYRADSAEAVTKTPLSFYGPLKLVLPVLPDVLALVIANPGAGYKLMDESLAAEAEPSDIHIAANWLFRLGFLRLKKNGSTYSYYPTAAGKRILTPPSRTPPAAPS